MKAMCGQLRNEARNSSGTRRQASLGISSGCCNSDFFSPESYRTQYLRCFLLHLNFDFFNPPSVPACLTFLSHSGVLAMPLL